MERDEVGAGVGERRGQIGCRGKGREREREQVRTDKTRRGMVDESRG
jgi:hypothetical protein